MSVKLLTMIGVALVAISCVERARHEATGTVAAKSASAAQPIEIPDSVSSPPPPRGPQTKTSEIPVGRYVLLLSRRGDDTSNMVTLKFQLAERENRQHVWDVAAVMEDALMT